MFLTLKFASRMIAIERKNIPYLWVLPVQTSCHTWVV